jgi:uncharacterized protein YdgA (DUF945 family)
MSSPAVTTPSMNSNSRHLKIAAAIVATFALLWFGINVYAGKRAESGLHELVAASGQSTSYRLRNLNHQRGMLASHGYVDLALIDECGAMSEPEWLTARVTYQLKHSVFPFALMHIEWSVEPLGKERETFERVFAGQAKLEGQGKVGLTGDVQSDMKLPEIQWASKGTRMTVSPSIGSVTVGKDTLKLDCRTGKIAARGDGSALALDGLGLEIDLTSVRRGLGKVAFTIDKLGTADFTADGMSLVTLMRENANRIDIDVTPGLKSLDAGGKQFKNLQLNFGLHGLHGPSTEDLLDLAQTSCNFQNLTQQENDKLQTGLRTLLFEGFSVGISKISGTVDGGELDGKWLVTLAKSQGDEFSLMPVLTSQGELTLTGKDIKPQQKKTLISLGFATAIPDGVRASYEFANGVLKVNGKVSNAVLLDAALQNMDQQIRGFLTGQTIRSTGGGPAEEEIEDPVPELET